MNEIIDFDTYLLIESVSQAEENAVKMCDITQKIMRVLSGYLDSISDQKSKIAAKYFELLDQNEWAKTISSNKDKLVKLVMSLYSELEKAEDFPKKGIDKATKIAIDYGITAAVFDGNLYVKTPLLLNRNHLVRSSGSGSFSQDYNHFFCGQVDKKLREIQDIIPQFSYKNVNILAVYNLSRQAIPDTDNLDTKKIIDAITDFFPGGDGGGKCSFSSASIQTDEIDEGTYFTVSEGFAIVPDFKANYVLLKRVFG